MAREETDQWLEKVFSAPDPAALGHAYDEWAEAYEADMLAVGYMHPSVAAGLVGRHVRNLAGAILDAGAGTGLLGQILWIMGYRNLAGIDLSEGMLSRARGRGVYGDLRLRRLGEALDFPDAHFDCVVSIGTLNISHAPPESLDEFARITRPGGHVVCTIPAKAWEEGGFGEKVEALERAGRWRALAATEPYRPMPLSPGEGGRTTRMLVYEIL
jgi:SAM-dependent methyltransferase